MGSPAPASPEVATRRFGDQTLAFLDGLVAVTGAVFYAVDRELNAMDHVFRRVGSDRLDDYVDYFHKLDPMHPRRFAGSGRTVVAIDDVLARPELERSTYYREFLRPVGGHHELELYLYDRDRLVGGVSLLRDTGHPSFSAAERTLVAKVRPYVEYNFGVDRRIAAAAGDVGGLTPRETEVVRLVCGGASNAGIARELGIALPTVKTHLEHVYEKLGVRTRAQLVARLAVAVGR